MIIYCYRWAIDIMYYWKQRSVIGKQFDIRIPSGMPVLTFYHFENWPLRTTLWYLLCKKDSIRLKKLPSVLLFLSLCIRPLCQTLSKALDKSKKIPRTSNEGLSSKAVKMLCVITVRWRIQESPGLKPDWIALSRQFWSKK